MIGMPILPPHTEWEVAFVVELGCLGSDLVRMVLGDYSRETNFWPPGFSVRANALI